MPISSGLLIETFTPQTLAETSDSQGGVTSAWTDGTAFRGRLSSLPIDERMSQDKQGLQSERLGDYSYTIAGTSLGKGMVESILDNVKGYKRMHF